MGGEGIQCDSPVGEGLSNMGAAGALCDTSVGGTQCDIQVEKGLSVDMGGV